jgi:hypothetical protein
METTLRVLGWDAEDTSGVRGMFTRPTAEMPKADDGLPPPVAEAVGMMATAAATGAATALAIAPYLRCLRMVVSLLMGVTAS